MSDPEKPAPGDEDSQEGWEGLTEDASGGSLAPSNELEAALAEASEAVESRESGGPAPSGAQTADKMILEALSSELQSLKAAYEAKEQELTEVNDRHVRLQAEFENFRRRNLKERQESANFGHQNLVKDLLSTVDNLDRAIDHAEHNDGGALKALLQGVELVRRELLGVLGKHGVTAIDTESGQFDPAVHEAMAQVPDGSVPPNHIVDVMQKGYQLRDRMMRPARVVVSRKPEEGETS